MLPTPKECLGPGYPLQDDKEREEYRPIWKRAFEIHKEAHVGDARHNVGNILPIRASESITGTPYCDCYIRAWLEVKSADQPRIVSKPTVEQEYNLIEERVI